MENVLLFELCKMENLPHAFIHVCVSAVDHLLCDCYSLAQDLVDFSSAAAADARYCSQGYVFVAIENDMLTLARPIHLVFFMAIAGLLLVGWSDTLLSTSRRAPCRDEGSLPIVVA
jgi:hypothetical protein